MRVALLLIGIAILTSSHLAAQTVERPRVATGTKNANNHDEFATPTAADATKPSDVEVLPQAGVAVGSTATSVQLHALKLYFTPTVNALRFYISSMLPTSTNQSTSSGSQTASQKPKPNDYLKSSLLDETGGLVNASLGFYKMPPMTKLPFQGDAGGHGLSIDARTGLKLVDVPPQEGQTAVKSNGINASPFWASVATIKFSAPLFDIAADGTSKSAGGLTFAISAMSTYATDADYATRFATTLKRRLANANATFAVNLTGQFYVELKGTFASNDPQIGKRFVVQLNGLR